MSDISLIILSAGNSSRFEMGIKKQWIRLGDDPLWLYVVKEFEALKLFSNIIITAHPHEVHYMKNHTKHSIVEGGSSRQASLKKALDGIDTDYVMVSDVARPCISRELIQRLLDAKEKADVVVPYLDSVDTLVYQNETVNREHFKRIQTPQLSRTQTLKKALNTTEEFTDESSAIVANGGSRLLIEGEKEAHKLTTIEDLKALNCLPKISQNYFVGSGFDVHAFEEGKMMALAGLTLPELDYGFKAHSDGDVAIHALIDALLGAAGMDDIGTLFPDSDASYKDIDSKKLLHSCLERIKSVGFELVHVDLTIMAQKPKIAPHKLKMRQLLAHRLGLEPIHVNIKATTTEELGFIGRKEGVATHATATLKYYDWTK